MQLHIRGRLYALAGIFALGCGVLAAVLIWLQNERAVEARQHSVEKLVDSAVGVLEVHRKLAEAGTMTEEEAKKRALQVMAGMRYGNGDYYFVEDRKGVVLMQPVTPGLVGKSLWDAPDSKGRYFVREMLQGLETGEYMDDLGAELGAAMWQAGLVTAVLALILSGLTFWIARGIAKPLAALR